MFFLIAPTRSVAPIMLAGVNVRALSASASGNPYFIAFLRFVRKPYLCLKSEEVIAKGIPVADTLDRLKGASSQCFRVVYETVAAS